MLETGSGKQWMAKGKCMEKSRNQISINQFKNVINILNPCMDDYLYIYAIRKDLYCISPSATERFALPADQFENVVENLKKITHSDDWKGLQQDLAQLMRKEKSFHNLQYRWKDKDGDAIWINCRGQLILGGDGEPEFLIGCINEIGKKQKADNISGLLGEFSLQNEMKRQKRKKLEGFMLRIGIDNFKEINENKGMSYGDMVLRKAAECISAAILPDQKLYRVVADEFAVLDFSGRGVEEAKEIFREIHRKIDSFIEDNGYEVFYTVSAGILDFADAKSQNYNDLMKWSEFALNKAKSGGKNKYCLYIEEDYQAFLHQRKLIQIMRQSVNRNFEGFEVYYQPIIDIKEKRLVNAEALLRFHTEETGMLSPVEFIPLLEESALIIPVGKWVLHQAMEACSKMQSVMPDFKVSVNLSYIQVLKSDILSEILYGVETYKLKPGSIVIELTESGFLEADSNFISFCEGLRSNGIPLALDDFGTGYSNFHYLYNLCPNTIKIDRSFTLKALNSDYEYNLLHHMVEMTHSIDLKLCIEGIETEQELERICEMGPDYIQGYYFGKPCSFGTFLEEYINAGL